MNEHGQWHWEDYTVDTAGTTGGRTITEADIVNFAGVSGDFHPAHVDRQHALALGVFPERIAHGLLGVAVVTGLLSRDAPTVLGTQFVGLAFLGMTWRFAGAVLAGDTIRVRHVVAGKRLTSSPGRGIVEHEVSVVNQDDVEVQSGVLTMLVATQGAPEA
jgi:acyl dehydratase